MICDERWYPRSKYTQIFQTAHDYPAIINKRTSIARKLGFPEVIMPGAGKNTIVEELRP